MQHFRNLNPYERHKLIINEYVLNRPGMIKLIQNSKIKGKTDIDVIRENHKFLWEDDDVAETWEEQLARKYYDKLFKEYCIGDLSRYKENKCGYIDYEYLFEVALRWRIEKEVITGKGQFTCGNKICTEENGLRSWEVNFAYMENGEKKNALVKLRLCPTCSDKLNYHSKKREIKRLKKQLKKDKKKHKTNKITTDSDNIQDDQEKGNKSTDNSMESHYVEETEINNECITASDSNDTEENINENENESVTKNTEEENYWRKPVEIEEPTREEEFEKYLEDLLL